MSKISFDENLPLVIVEAVIKHKTARDLILALDTGSSRTIIPYEIAQAIGCDPARSSKRTRIVTGSGVEIAPLVRVGSISALGIAKKNFELACHDLPQEGYVDGLLGLDFLKGHKLLVDFKKGTVTIK